MKGKKAIIVAIVLIVIIFIALIFWVEYRNNMHMSALSNNVYGAYKTIVIDAGHGDVDGGASAADGTVEKELNLQIAKKLEVAMKAMGFNVIMTRSDDTGLHDSSAKTIGQKKVSDLHNRLKLIESTPNSFLVSIHQNHFTHSKYTGTQVFYAPNSTESERLAQCIQDSVAEKLQPENHRKVKKSGTSIYILYYAKTPSVMVECGFLSNHEETQRLKDDEYQNKIVFCIMSGIFNFLAQEEG